MIEWVWERVESRKVCRVDRSDHQRGSFVVTSGIDHSPWKQPGDHTGISTINSARSFSQLPLKLPPMLLPLLASTSNLPSWPSARPVRARLARFSMIATTRSVNTFVSPSTVCTFC